MTSHRVVAPPGERMMTDETNCEGINVGLLLKGPIKAGMTTFSVQDAVNVTSVIHSVNISGDRKCCGKLAAVSGTRSDIYSMFEMKDHT